MQDRKKAIQMIQGEIYALEKDRAYRLGIVLNKLIDRYIKDASGTFLFSMLGSFDLIMREDKSTKSKKILQESSALDDNILRHSKNLALKILMLGMLEADASNIKSQLEKAFLIIHKALRNPDLKPEDDKIVQQIEELHTTISDEYNKAKSIDFEKIDACFKQLQKLMNIDDISKKDKQQKQFTLEDAKKLNAEAPFMGKILVDTISDIAVLAFSSHIRQRIFEFQSKTPSSSLFMHPETVCHNKLIQYRDILLSLKIDEAYEKLKNESSIDAIVQGIYDSIPALLQKDEADEDDILKRIEAYVLDKQDNVANPEFHFPWKYIANTEIALTQLLPMPQESNRSQRLEFPALEFKIEEDAFKYGFKNAWKKRHPDLNEDIIKSVHMIPACIQGFQAARSDEFQKLSLEEAQENALKKWKQERLNEARTERAKTARKKKGKKEVEVLTPRSPSLPPAVSPRFVSNLGKAADKYQLPGMANQEDDEDDHPADRKKLK